MMKMEMQQIYKGDEMNYLKYIIYHNCDKGRIVYDTHKDFSLVMKKRKKMQNIG